MDKNTIICSGCSFTWGQGLWMYLETDKFIPGFWDYISDKYPIPTEGELLRKKLRWPHLVASHFNFEEIVKPYNGGTDKESIEFIDYLLDKNLSGKYTRHFGNKKTSTNECSWIIFQTTQLYRSPFCFEYDGVEYKLASTPNLRNLSMLEKKLNTNDFYPYEEVDSFEPFYNWLYENNYHVEDFESLHKKRMSTLLEETFKKYEKLGVKIGIVSWTDEYLDIFMNNEYFKNRFITLEHDGKRYRTIEKLQEDYKHFFIKNDPTKLHEDTYDEHPSKECHEVIAQNVIRYIENYE